MAREGQGYQCYQFDMMMIIFSTGSFGEYFLFYGLTEFYVFIRLWLEGMGSSCPRFFPLSLPGVWHEILPHLFTTNSVPKLIFFYPISADGKKVPLPFLLSSSFSSQSILWDYYLFDPVTECKHLLAFILTWIYYLWNWPRFLFLANSNTEG